MFALRYHKAYTIRPETLRQRKLNLLHESWPLGNINYFMFSYLIFSDDPVPTDLEDTKEARIEWLQSAVDSIIEQ